MTKLQEYTIKALCLSVESFQGLESKLVQLIGFQDAVRQVLQDMLNSIGLSHSILATHADRIGRLEQEIANLRAELKKNKHGSFLN